MYACSNNPTNSGVAIGKVPADSATNFRPTPGVRTFAGQFDHIVSTNLDVAAVALRGLKAAPALGDTAVYLHNKAALRKSAREFRLGGPSFTVSRSTSRASS